MLPSFLPYDSYFLQNLLRGSLNYSYFSPNCRMRPTAIGGNKKDIKPSHRSITMMCPHRRQPLLLTTWRGSNNIDNAIILQPFNPFPWFSLLASPMDELLTSMSSPHRSGLALFPKGTPSAARLALFLFTSAVGTGGVTDVFFEGFRPMVVPSSSSSAGGGGYSCRYRAIRGQKTRDTVLRRGWDGREQETERERDRVIRAHNSLQGDVRLAYPIERIRGQTAPPYPQ